MALSLRSRGRRPLSSSGSINAGVVLSRRSTNAIGRLSMRSRDPILARSTMSAFGSSHKRVLEIVSGSTHRSRESRDGLRRELEASLSRIARGKADPGPAALVHPLHQGQPGQDSEQEGLRHIAAVLRSGELSVLGIANDERHRPWSVLPSGCDPGVDESRHSRFIPLPLAVNFGSCYLLPRRPFSVLGHSRAAGCGV